MVAGCCDWCDFCFISFCQFNFIILQKSGRGNRYFSHQTINNWNKICNINVLKLQSSTENTEKKRERQKHKRHYMHLKCYSNERPEILIYVEQMSLVIAWLSFFVLFFAMSFFYINIKRNRTWIASFSSSFSFFLLRYIIFHLSVETHGTWQRDKSAPWTRKRNRPERPNSLDLSRLFICR